MAITKGARWLPLVGLAMACVLWPIAADTQEETLQAEVTKIVAGFYAVPEAQLGIGSVERTTHHDRPAVRVQATIRGPDGRTVNRVFAYIDGELRYVMASGRRVFDTQEAQQIAEEFVRTTYPAWSDDMLLQEAVRSDDRLMLRWAEKRGEVWTGSFVGMSCTVYRPGVPATYSAYVATPRSVDEIEITKDEAVVAARQFLADRGYESEVVSVELHLDSLFRPFPDWWVMLRAKQRDALAQQADRTVNVLVDATTGEIVARRSDDEQQ